MAQENQRVVITKRMLKESMLSILKEKELDTINVAELCRKAGVNRATFYRHYEIPRDVLMEIQQDLYRELLQQVKLPQATGDIRPMIEKLCVFLDDHQELLRILVRSNSDTEFADFMQDMYLELAKEYSHLGMLKRLDQEDIALLTLYSTGGSYFVLRSWIMGSIKKTPREMADYVYSLVDKTKQLLMSSLLADRQEKASGKPR